MSFSLALSPWLLALGLAVALALAVGAYRRTVPPLGRGLRLTLGTLRFLALALVLFLLFEPVARQLSTLERPPVLAVLLDTSQSLRVTTSGDAGDADAATAVADSAEAVTRARAAVAEALAQLRASGFDGEARFFAFDQTLRPLADAAALDTLAFDGPRTDLAGALDALRQTLQNDNLQGVALVTDGQYNAGRNPLYVAERYPVPLFPIAVGDTARRRDVQVRRVTTNEVAYVGTELPVRVGLRGESVAGETVSVALMQDGQTLARERVTLPEGTAEVPVDLTFAPESAGLRQLTVAVSRLDGEATYRNNAQTLTVRVLDRKRRVLLLGAAPSPSFASTRRLLSADRNTEVTARLPRRDGRFYGGAFPDTLAAFDALMLAGFPSADAPAAVVERVAEAAAEKPLVVLLDRQTDLRRLADAFGDRLPAQPERIRPGYGEALFVRTAAGERHPVFDIDGADDRAWRQLPPLLVSQSRWTPTPDATVLATVEVRGVALDDPALVVRRRSGQRSAMLLGTGTWRWANLPEGLAPAEPLWPGLLTNLLQWVTAPTDDRPVRVTPTKPSFAGSETVSFTGQVYDESLNPIPDAAVDVTVTAPDGTTYPFGMEAVGSGRYTLDVGTLPEGTYRYAATAARDGTTLGTDRGQFSVGALTLEFQETRADLTLLRQLAQRSGGAVYQPEGAGDLPVRLASSETFRPVVVEQERTTELWRRIGFLVAILVLLAAEWAVRKRFGLA
jgi:hypothetical protein